MNKVKNKINEINPLLEDEEFCLEYLETFKDNKIQKGILLKSNLFNCNPIMYPEPEMLEQSNEEIIERLKQFFMEHRKNIDVEFLQNREYILSEVLPKVYSFEQIDKIQKKKIVCTIFLDMVVTFYVPLTVSEDKIINIIITEALLKKVGIDIIELEEAARRNIATVTTIDSMRELLIKMGIPEEDIEANHMQIWVVSNERKNYGAGALISKDVLKRLEEKIGSSYVILPSSLHEIICIPYNEDELDSMKKMVLDINLSYVKVEDKLTDSIYTYIDGEVTPYMKKAT